MANADHVEFEKHDFHWSSGGHCQQKSLYENEQVFCSIPFLTLIGKEFGGLPHKDNDKLLDTTYYLL